MLRVRFVSQVAALPVDIWLQSATMTVADLVGQVVAVTISRPRNQLLGNLRLRLVCKVLQVAIVQTELDQVAAVAVRQPLALQQAEQSAVTEARDMTFQIL